MLVRGLLVAAFFLGAWSTSAGVSTIVVLDATNYAVEDEVPIPDCAVGLCSLRMRWSTFCLTPLLGTLPWPRRSD